MRVLSYCRAGGEAEFWLCLKKKNHDRVKKKLLFRVAILNCTHMSKIRAGTVGMGFSVLWRQVGHPILCHLQLLRLGPDLSKCFAAGRCSAHKTRVRNK